LQTIVDSDVHPDNHNSTDARYYDIIGFDPRGVGETRPAVWCMDDAAAWSWNLRESEEGILGSSDAALGRLWAMTHAWGESCKQAINEEEGLNIKQYNIKQYVSTASVARDMLEIVERHAEVVGYVSVFSVRLECPRSCATW
jgi:pimeloyl-ACP methyl ester carboxylesterase